MSTSRRWHTAATRLVVVTGFVAAAIVWSPAAPSWTAAGETQPGGDTTITPFTIDVPDTVLEDLRARLTRARFPDELEGVDWAYGTPLPYLRELVDYWRDEFDWREQERLLNEFEQFTTTIDGLEIHFIHRRSENPDAFPLLITHGWPGSFMEFTKMIGPLTDPEGHGGNVSDAFHVVIPSIPGFGFSDKPRAPGYHAEKMSEIFATLMARLGYTRYGAQGGDWGALIGAPLAIHDAAHVAGLHLNMCLAGPPPGVADPDALLSPEDRERAAVRAAFQAKETGYSQMQGTKPQTIGTVLNDSPVGLAAWIVEKFRTWCDCDGDPESVFTRDELLTNITIYWVTQTATSSARIYYESTHAERSVLAGRVDVPTACAVFPAEPFTSPRPWVDARYNVTRWSELPRGGHFPALEQPELLIADVREFFRDLR